MGFLVERIPDEAKEKYPFIDTPYSSKWVIDRDRDMFMALVNTGGGARVGTPVEDTYVLCSCGELIPITADQMAKSLTEQGAVMNWRVHRLDVPESLSDRKAEVLQLICDAFTAVGQAFDGHRFLSVSVEFDLSSDK